MGKSQRVEGGTGDRAKGGSCGTITVEVNECIRAVMKIKEQMLS